MWTDRHVTTATSAFTVRRIVQASCKAQHMATQLFEKWKNLHLLSSNCGKRSYAFEKVRQQPWSPTGVVRTRRQHPSVGGNLAPWLAGHWLSAALRPIMARSPTLVNVFSYGPHLKASQQDCQCCRRVALRPFLLSHASLEHSQWLARAHFIQRQALDHTLSGPASGNGASAVLQPLHALPLC